MTHARAGTGIEHLPGLRSRRISTSYPRNPLVSCDFMSHCFDKIIAVLLREMASSGHQLIQHTRRGRCLVRRHRARVAAVIQSPSKEPTSGCQVPLLRHQYVDELAILVDGSVQVDPPPGNLRIRFIGKPPITGHMPAGPDRIN